MNNSNPFIPQGSLLDQKNKKRARVKVAVFSIFAFNLLVIIPLLIQGCGGKKEAPADVTPPPPAADTNVPDTNIPPPLPGASNAAPATASNAVPAYTPPPPPAPTPEVPTTKEYVVAKGDTYFSIAKKFGVKMKEVEAANPTVPATKLKVGMKLQVPGSSGGGTTAGIPAGGSDSSGSVYVVKAGDSLTKIAKLNGVSLKALRAENELKTDKIKVGQKLKVPAKSAAAEAAPPAPAPEPAAPANPAPPPAQPGAGTMR